MKQSHSGDFINQINSFLLLASIENFTDKNDIMSNAQFNDSASD